MKLSLGFSPCPNDTFIFDALVNKKIDTAGFEFEVVLQDVETLNQWALQATLDITKLSFPAFFQSIDQYLLLNSGSALGKGVGPLLISKSEVKDQEQKMENLIIGLPGLHTTANLLFSFAYPNALKKKFMIFSSIEEAVLRGKIDLGVIIHENRFTYQQKGLYKIRDLGEYWEQQMNAPIPLGAIAIKRKLGAAAGKVNSLIKQSLDFAYSNYPVIADYVKQHSQEMSEDVMRQHIDLYVNNYSLDLGIEGRLAIETLHDVYNQSNKKAIAGHSLFL
ncbi:MAG TPA: 1,4-dihydroxy-6-naphthoate synthase [Chitinophagaceae bacterium]|nr:1,4-dihydroxy-6-naphthoate synthase [Chitinophagaceae bacterium]